jgi:peptidyl-prolyl cis-trans isomerase C
VAALEAALRDALAPTQLEVIDESAAHAGIQAPMRRATAPISGCASPPEVRRKPRVARHRLVYDALQVFIAQGLHASPSRCSESSYWLHGVARSPSPRCPGRRSSPLLSASLRFPSRAFSYTRISSPADIHFMKKHILQAVAAAALIGAIPMAALAQNAAIVNGKPVPKARMDVLAQQLAAAGRPVTPEMQSQLREEIVAREVFMQEAQKQGLDASDDYKNQLELARQAILIRALFDNYRKTNPISDADVKAEYDKFVAANGGKEYKARHILVETEDQAKKILADLKKGGKFEDIAKKQSKDPGSGANGGDLDWANPANFVPEFSEAMIKLKKGETTPAPIKTQFGYHIIRVDDIRQAQLPKLEEVKPQVTQQLQQQRLQKYQEELRAKAKVE